MGIRCADHVTPLYPQKLALTSPTGGGRFVGIVRSRTKATEWVMPDARRKSEYGVYKQSVNREKLLEMHSFKSSKVRWLVGEKLKLGPSELRLFFCSTVGWCEVLFTVKTVSNDTAIQWNAAGCGCFVDQKIYSFNKKYGEIVCNTENTAVIELDFSNWRWEKSLWARMYVLWENVN